jgi:hypothetical protein
MGLELLGGYSQDQTIKGTLKFEKGRDDLRRILGRADRRRSTTGRVTRYYESLISSKTKVFFCTMHEGATKVHTDVA